MKIDSWWRAPLLEWADTTGCNVEFEMYGRISTKRDAGEWWLGSGRWYLHLDSKHYAWIIPEPDLTIRRTLTWMLSFLKQGQRPSAELQLTSWVEELLSVPQSGIDRLLAGENHRSPPESHWVEKYGSGWFGLLMPQYPKTVTLEERAELRQNIGQVVGGYAADGLVGWMRINRTEEQALLFISDDALPDLESLTEGEAQDAERLNAKRIVFEASHRQGFWKRDLEDTTEFELAETDRVSPALLRKFMENLLDSLRQDALVTCGAVVGLRLAKSSDLVDSLLTSVVLGKRYYLSDSNRGVGIWGEYPLNILLQTLPLGGVRWFLDAVHPLPSAAVGQDADKSFILPDELMSSLQALVNANLNISEASRLLFVHRNTLIHRVERIRELTGYDARNFQEALTLWLSYKLRPSLDEGKFREE